jgi:hypothetical protein
MKWVPVTVMVKSEVPASTEDGSRVRDGRRRRALSQNFGRNPVEQHHHPDTKPEPPSLDPGWGIRDGTLHAYLLAGRICMGLDWPRSGTVVPPATPGRLASAGTKTTRGSETPASST